MKKIYFLLIIIFSIMLVMKHDDVFSQERRVVDTTIKRTPTCGANPCPGSIWVNRDENFGKVPVTSLTPEQLVREVLLGQKTGCATSGTITNVTFKGYNWVQTGEGTGHWAPGSVDRGLSYFSHGTPERDTVINGVTLKWGLGMTNGLLLTTGGGRGAEGPNNFTDALASNGNAMLNDADMYGLDAGCKDGSLLEFDFIPLQSTISFDYIFASEEYPDQIGVNDVFGFFISGPGIPGGKTNIALLPNSSTIVSINNVNWGNHCNGGPSCFPGCPTSHSCGVNAKYYLPNYDGTGSGNSQFKGDYMEYDGRTVMLTAKANVIPGETYHLKLGIANVMDHLYGSGVFLRAGSLELGATLKNLREDSEQMNNIFESCETNKLEISFIKNTVTSITLEYSGSAANDIVQLSGSPMPTSIPVALGDSLISIPYKVKSPVTNGGIIRIVSSLGTGDCEQKDTLYLTVYSSFTPEIQTTIACNGNTGSITVNSISGGSPRIKMSIDNGATWKHWTSSFTNLAAADYTLMLTDSVSCDTLFIPVTVDSSPVLSNTSTVIPDICSGGTANYTATCSISGVSFSWTRAAVTGILQPLGIGTNATINETLTNTTSNPITVTYVYTLSINECTNTQEVTVLVNPALSQPDPTGATIPYNTTHSFSLGAATGAMGNITYLWQQSPDGITWASAQGTNSNQNYTTPALTANTFYRRLAMANSCGETIYSDTALVRLACAVTLIDNPLGKGVLTGAGIYTSGESATIGAVSNDACYEFIKWTTINGDSITNQNPFTFTVNKDTTLIAFFRLITNQVSVTIVPTPENPPMGNQVTGSGAIICGNNATLTAIPDDCYEFFKWTTANGDSITNQNPLTFTVTSDTNLVAVFKLIYYVVNLSVAAEPANGGTVSGPSTVPCEEYATILATPNPCFTFKNWTVNGVEVSTNASFTFQVTGDYDFVANFEQKKFNVTVSANPAVGNNAVTGGGTGILCGATVTLTATPDECYTFVNWTKNGNVVSTNATHQLILMGDSTYVANFAIKTFSVGVSANPMGGGTATVTGNSTGINCNAQVNVKAVADPCYNFVNWTNFGGTVVSTNADFTFTIKKDTVLIANFTIKTYNINVSMSPSSGAGTVTGGGTYNCGDPVTVTAVADFCYTFENWTENGTPIPGAGASYTFTANAPRNLVANFKIRTFTVTVLKNTPSNNSVSPNIPIHNVSCGNAVNINATPDTFHTFVNWTDSNGTGVSTTQGTLVTVMSDTTLIANFAPKTYTIKVSAFPVSPIPGGTVTGNGTNIPYNTQWTVTAIPNAPLYKFSHWEDYGTRVEDAGAIYSFPVTGDRDLVAIFVKETVIIRVIAEPDTGGMAYQSAYKVALDSLCYVWATPSICAHFTKWTTLDNTVLSVKDTLWFTVYPDLYTHIIDGVITFVAHFMPNSYEITLEPSPPHGGDVYCNGVLGGDGYFSCNTEIEIKAVAKHPKYKFIKWVEILGTDTLSVTNDSIYTFKVRESRRLVALFELIMYEITVLPNPTSCGEVTGGGFFPYDSVITVHALAFDECTFYDWTEDGVPQSSIKGYNFTVTRDRVLYANFIPKTFEVKVIASPLDAGHVTKNDINIPYGTLWEITAKPNPTWEFSHWGDNVTGAHYPWDTIHTIAVTRDFDLTAYFVRKQYEITLESDPAAGGTTTGAGTFVHGTVITVEAFEGECHTFSHWTDNGATVCSTPDYTFTVTGPRHLVAHFIPEMYDINLTSNPSGGGTLTGGGLQACLSQITVTATPDTCYVFVNWTEDGTVVCSTPNFTFTVNEPRNLVANFVQKLFNITTSVDPVVAPPGSGTVVLTGGDPRDIPCGEERTVEAVPQIGYVFTHWTFNGIDFGNTNPYSFNVMEELDIVAHFDYTVHDITLYVLPTPGGQAKTGGTYPHGYELTVHAIPNPCFVFVKWTEDGVTVPGAGADYTFIVDRPRTLTAHFDTATFSVTTAPSPLEGGITFGDATDIPCGTSITVTAEPKECFTFDYWSVNGVWKWGAPSYTFPVTQSCHLVAHFKKETYNITLKANPSFPPGGVPAVVGGSAYNIPCGDSITIQSNPFTNYNFVNWTRNGVQISTDDPYPLTVTQNDTITANYTLKSYNVILDVAPPGIGGTVWLTPQNNIPHGTLIEIHAQADSCYKFLYWKEFGETDVFSYKPHILDLPVHKSMHLVAYFEPKGFDVIPVPSPLYGGTVWDTAYNVACGTYYTVHAKENTPFFQWDRWTYEDGVTTASLNRNYGFYVTESRKLIAHFTTVSFEIEVSANPPVPIGGTVGGAGTYDYGMTIPITATPDTCYQFDGWYENDLFVSSDNPFMFTVDGPHHFVAHFVQKLFDITTSVVSSPGIGGTVTVTGGDPTGISCNEDRDVLAVANTGYVFDYWVINGTNMGDTNPYPLTKIMEDKAVEAHFQYLQHTITLVPNSFIKGTVSGGGTFPHNTPITAKADPNPGFKFIQWMEEDTVVLNAPQYYSFNVIKDRLLVAIFDSATYRVTTAPSPAIAGTTTPEDTAGLAYQALLTVNAIPNENFTFKHWMEDNVPILSAGPTYPFPVTKDHDLIAVFEPKKYNVTLGKNPSTGGNVSGGGYNLPYGNITKIIAIPNPNYDFYNWTNEDGIPVHATDTAYHKVEKTEHLTANFTPKKYNIIVSASPMGWGKAWDSHYDVPYNTVVTIHAEAVKGYVFDGWYENNTKIHNINPWPLTVTGSRELQARFVEETYDIILKANPTKGGTVKGGGYGLDYGKEITIEAEPANQYYTFINWTDETGKVFANTATHTFLVEKSDILTANFRAITSKITLLADPAGTGVLTADGLVGGGDIARGETIEILAKPDSCYTFDYWSENGVVFKDTPAFEITVDENNRTFVAHFTQKLIDVTVSANPPEGGLASGDASNLPCGEEITLTAIANNGYHFVNWTLNGKILSSSEVFPYKTTESGEVIANFALNQHTITLLANPQNLGAVSGGGNYEYGKEITVRATPKSGYMFINWTENGKEVSKTADYPFTVTESRTLVANFDTTYFTVTVLVNDTLFGTACCTQKYKENEMAQVNAFVKQGYRFLNWTENDTIRSSTPSYSFEVTRNITLVANFYGLDFDTYAATLWDNTFMLDLKKLEGEGYDITGCKWFKNNKWETNTHTIDEFSYSAGPKITDKLELAPTYYFFQVTIKNGSLLYSTKKILTNHQYYQAPPNDNLFVYPNPASSGTLFTVENAIAGALMQVYNQYGMCVKTLTASASTITLSLDLPAGIYLIRNENKEAKVVITK